MQDIQIIKLSINWYTVLFHDKSSPVCDKKQVGPVVIAEGGKVHKDTGGSLFFPQTGQDKVPLGPVPGVRLQTL